MAADVDIRPGEGRDARTIAELYQYSSDGVADYIWDSLKADYPGLGLLDIGEKRYARENTDFSYQNCRIAEAGGAIAGMAHSYVMGAPEPLPDEFDPVLRPFAELELPGSLYISGIAMFPDYRGQGMGNALMDDADKRARDLGCDTVSLIVFEQNAGAKRLYDRRGFEEVMRRQIVPHPLIHMTGDAILMARPVA